MISRGRVGEFFEVDFGDYFGGLFLGLFWAEVGIGGQGRVDFGFDWSRWAGFTIDGIGRSVVILSVKGRQVRG